MEKIQKIIISFPLEIHRFGQAARLIPAVDLPPGVTVESRQGLLDDRAALSKNLNESEDQRKALADSLVQRMRDLMQGYCAMVKSNPNKYGKEYLNEFKERLYSVKAEAGLPIRENSKAGPITIISMLVYLFCAFMRIRYD